MKKHKTLRRCLLAVGLIVLALALLVGGYLLYVVLQYSRIPDNTPLDVQSNAVEHLGTGIPYTAMTYNIGFGAYDTDFSFFMDGGTMKDGTPVQGKYGRAQSAEIVQSNTDGAETIMQAADADFYLVQEVDTDSTRSWHINQAALLQEMFSGWGSTFSSNFHSAFLAYPLHEFHGKSNAGLLTLSRYAVDSAVRRSYPVDDSFPTRFFDLDRCFSVHVLPVDGAQGKQLVLINSHMSAYDEGGSVRAAQMQMLCGVLAEEAAKGNYVIVGGDFNHALSDTLEQFESQQNVPEWVYDFDENALPEGFRVVTAENATDVATCRSTDMPYTAGVNYTAVLDGFIVSDNVTATATNVDTSFAYSDHNPVVLTFTLRP